MQSGPNIAREFKARLIDVFDDPSIVRKSAINIRDGAGIFEHILIGSPYRTVLEIGTYRGITAAFMAQFVERVITIDLKHGRMERHHENYDRKAIWRSLGISNIDLHLVENDEDKAKLIGGLDFDFAFIDGDHIAPAPQRDFELVKRCGVVLFHDYGADNGVTKFVDTLPKDRVLIRDIFALWVR